MENNISKVLPIDKEYLLMCMKLIKQNLTDEQLLEFLDDLYSLGCDAGEGSFKNFYLHLDEIIENYSKDIYGKFLDEIADKYLKL